VGQAGHAEAMVIDASSAMMTQPSSDQPAEMPIMWHTQRSIDASTRLLLQSPAVVESAADACLDPGIDKSPQFAAAPLLAQTNKQLQQTLSNGRCGY
jgi:hypothetical protein